MPNPWDAGSAVFLERAGFAAVATTSAGMSFSMARPDEVGAVSLDATLEHVRSLAAATDLPLNADFQSGYAATARGVADNVRRCVEAGVAGLSIEDTTGDASTPLYSIEEATERMRAAREAIDATSPGVLLTGRADGYLIGKTDLDDAVKRLRAYADAGADCLFAPGFGTPEQIAVIVAAVAPKPVNVVIRHGSDLPVNALRDLGVRRVSVGSALARVAWGAVMRAVGRIVREGRFDGLEGAASFDELNRLFGEARR